MYRLYALFTPTYQRNHWQTCETQEQMGACATLAKHHRWLHDSPVESTRTQDIICQPLCTMILAGTFVRTQCRYLDHAANAAFLTGLEQRGRSKVVQLGKPYLSALPQYA